MKKAQISHIMRTGGPPGNNGRYDRRGDVLTNDSGASYALDEVESWPIDRDGRVTDWILNGEMRVFHDR